MRSSRFATISLTTGAIAASAAAACCAGPRLAAVVGCNARWIARLFTTLAGYHVLFVAIAAIALGFAHYQLYGTPRLWAGEVARSVHLRRQRAALWLIACVAVALVLLPLYVPLP